MSEGGSFEADAQFAKGREPGMGAFDDPAMPTQTIVALDAP
jgi:hypothetical protein